MSDVYVYLPNEEDCSTIGLCGALTPTECVYTEIANGNSSIRLTHPKDDLGRYTLLNENYIIKAAVPVRNAPEINYGAYVTSVDRYTVKAGQTKNDRSIWSKKWTDPKKRGKILYTPKAGQEVVITAVYNRDDRRDKCSCTYTSKGKKKTVTGYINRDALTLEQSSVPVSPTSEGLEKVAPSWVLKDQLFRIYSVSKTDSEVTVEAQHISYDLMYNLTTYSKDGSATLQAVMDGVLDGCIDDVGITFQTNILGEKAGHHWRSKDPITALLDPDQGCVSRWNGHLIRDNSDLTVLDQAGANRGVRLEYGKNIKGVDYSLDLSGTCTAIRPRGTDKNGNDLFLQKDYLIRPDYSGADEIAGSSLGVVYSPIHESYPFERIFSLDGDDCTANDAKESADRITDSIVRSRLLEQTVQAFKDGADQPKLTLSVDLVDLSHDPAYAEYAELERIFLFDTLTVSVPRMGIAEEATVSQIEWDCLMDAMQSIVLGTVSDLTAQVASWQISSVNGTKLISGSVNSRQLAEDSVTARTVAAEAIYTDALQSLSITTQKLAASSVTTEKIKAGAVTADKVDAGSVSAALVETDVMKARITETAHAAIGTADIGYAQIKDAEVENLFSYDQSTDRMYVRKLGVTSASILNLMTGLLVFRGTDGNYYQLDAVTDSNGNVSMRPISYDSTKVDEDTGLTSDGRYVFEDTVDVNDLYASNAKLGDAMITRLTVDKLFVTDSAFVNKLVTSQLFAEGGLLTLSDWRDQYRRIITVDADRGTLFHDQSSETSGVLIDRDSKVNIVNDGVTYSSFAKKYVRFGDYELRKSADGGLVFKMREG